MQDSRLLVSYGSLGQVDSSLTHVHLTANLNDNQSIIVTSYYGHSMCTTATGYYFMISTLCMHYCAPLVIIICL